MFTAMSKSRAMVPSWSESASRILHAHPEAATTVIIWPNRATLEASGRAANRSAQLRARACCTLASVSFTRACTSGMQCWRARHWWYTFGWTYRVMSAACLENQYFWKSELKSRRHILHLALLAIPSEESLFCRQAEVEMTCSTNLADVRTGLLLTELLLTDLLKNSLLSPWWQD